MRKLSLLTLILVMVLLFTATPSRAAGTYVVQPGDTLFSIAARFRVSISELATINRIYDVNAIFVGQTLTLPAPLPAGYVPGYPVGGVYGPPAPSTGGLYTTTVTYRYYTVRSGDYLALIAQRYNVSAQAILAANYLPNPNLLYVGMRLVIPVSSGIVVLPKPKPVYGNIYIVQPGDTLSGIAARFGRDMYNIARANGLLDLNAVYAGVALVIP
jgi:LysM repeat protein